MENRSISSAEVHDPGCPDLLTEDLLRPVDADRQSALRTKAVQSALAAMGAELGIDIAPEE